MRWKGLLFGVAAIFTLLSLALAFPVVPPGPTSTSAGPVLTANQSNKNSTMDSAAIADATGGDGGPAPGLDPGLPGNSSLADLEAVMGEINGTNASLADGNNANKTSLTNLDKFDPANSSKSLSSTMTPAFNDSAPLNSTMRALNPSNGTDIAKVGSDTTAAPLPLPGPSSNSSALADPALSPNASALPLSAFSTNSTSLSLDAADSTTLSSGPASNSSALANVGLNAKVSTPLSSGSPSNRTSLDLDPADAALTPPGLLSNSSAAFNNEGSNTTAAALPPGLASNNTNLGLDSPATPLPSSGPLSNSEKPNHPEDIEKDVKIPPAAGLQPLDGSNDKNKTSVAKDSMSAMGSAATGIAPLHPGDIPGKDNANFSHSAAQGMGKNSTLASMSLPELAGDNATDSSFSDKGNGNGSAFDTSSGKASPLPRPPTNATAIPSPGPFPASNATSTSSGPLSAPGQPVDGILESNMSGPPSTMGLFVPQNPENADLASHWDFESPSRTPPYMVQNDTLFSQDRLQSYEPAPYETRYTAQDDYRGTFDVPKHWGSIAPYFASPAYPDAQEWKLLPKKCQLKQVHMLHRNGARMPASDDLNYTAGSFTDGRSLNATGPLSFLNHWTSDLGQARLTAAGSQQLFDSGVEAFYRYGALFNASDKATKPLVRTTSKHRLYDSAAYWTMGFFGLDAPSMVNFEVLVDDRGYNSTLSSDLNGQCPNAETLRIGNSLKDQWINIYLQDAVKRFSRHVKSFKLTTKTVFTWQLLCAYETFALGESNFCPLFTVKEWEGFEYAHDLYEQGNSGFMSPTGRAQGIGWAQEFISRLKMQPFEGAITSQNATIDNDPQLFPVDQPLFFDFSHDSKIVEVLTALNFTQFNSFLNATHINTKRSFYASHIVPFGARLFFEVLECPLHSSLSASRPKEYIRTILNDAIIPMTPSQGCAKARSDGLCPLQDFIDHFDYMVEGSFSKKGSRAAGGGSSGGASNNSANVIQNYHIACYGKNGTDFLVPPEGVKTGTVIPLPPLPVG